MMRALYSAASGMIAQQYNMDTISNNLANVNTTGFRKNVAHFQDLVYQQIQAPRSPVGESDEPVGQEVGLGVKVGSSEKIYAPASPVQSSLSLDDALPG